MGKHLTGRLLSNEMVRDLFNLHELIGHRLFNDYVSDGSRTNVGCILQETSTFPESQIRSCSGSIYEVMTGCLGYTDDDLKGISFLRQHTQKKAA